MVFWMARAARRFRVAKKAFFARDRVFFWFAYARGRRAVFRTAWIGEKFVDTAENRSKQVCSLKLYFDFLCTSFYSTH